MFNKVELLDFAGPYEVFSTRQNNDRKHQGIHHFRGRSDQIRQRTHRHPDYSFNYPKIDILIIPGGEGTKAGKKKVMEDRQDRDRQIMATLRSGARIAAVLGLFDGLEARLTIRS